MACYYTLNTAASSRVGPHTNISSASKGNVTAHPAIHIPPHFVPGFAPQKGRSHSASHDKQPVRPIVF